MRFTKPVVMFLAVAVVAGCTNTYHGAKRNLEDNANWLHGEPSHMAKHWGHVPTGYTGQNIENIRLIKPYPKYLPLSKWREIKTLPAGMDGVVVVESTGVYTDTGQGYPAAPQGFGQLAQEVYFAHGSAKISKADRERLAEFARSIQGTQNNVAMTVVGHASTRVDGVTDPVRRKEINFEIAQKRANAVTNELQKAGVTPAWIEAISRGDEEPNMNPGDKSQEAADRRSEIYMNGQ